MLLLTLSGIPSMVLFPLLLVSTRCFADEACEHRRPALVWCKGALLFPASSSPKRSCPDLALLCVPPLGAGGACVGEIQCMRSKIILAAYLQEARSTGRLCFWGLIGSKCWADLKYCWLFKRHNYVIQSICLMFLIIH